MPGTRGTSVIVLIGGILLVAGCQKSSNAHSRSDAPLPSASSGASVTAGTPSDAPAPSTPPGSVTTPAATPTPAATSSHASAAPAHTPAPTRAGTSHPPQNLPGCRNLVVVGGVKDAVTTAYERRFPHFRHIRPASHQFFYGQCDGVGYAATRFQLTPGATYEERVGMQDEGSATKYFRATSTGHWVYIASDGFPSGPHGCADVPQIPSALAAAWGDCSVAG
ncbi:hypothetical protein [Streptomyces sp. MUSC 125]|uniref:hypothetical protein n=1 Tax=Streptomyces sp. MUSC 125 TaxID=1428624 RepID=UPI00131C3E66|nr:hypothetical protein [Streptomyces sp. MUSC 125]